MALKYCEFEPTQHRNKRVAQFIFLDDPDDPHPLAICDVCSKKLLQMRPNAIVRDRKAKPPKEKPAEPEPAPAEQASESEPDVEPETEPSP